MCQVNPEHVEKDVEQMLSDPKAWRLDSLPFMPSASKHERMQGHRRVREEAEALSVSESGTFKRQEILEDDLIVTIIGHRNLMKDFHEMGNDDADKQFWKTYAEQQGKEDREDGTKRVRVQDEIARDRCATGTQSAELVRSSAELTAEAFGVRKRRLDKRIARKRHSDSGSDSDDVAITAKDDKDVDAKSVSCPGTLGKSTAASSDNIIVPLSLGGENSARSAKSSGSATTATPKKLSSKEAVVSLSLTEFNDDELLNMASSTFLAAKETLDLNLKSLMKSLTNPQHGMITQLQKAERTLLQKEGNADDLNYKAEDILAEMEDVVKQLTQAITELAKVKKADFLRLQGVYKSEVSRVFALTPKYDDLIHGLRKKNLVTGCRNRMAYQADYQKMRKIKEALILGGHSNGYSKLVSQFSAASLSGATEFSRHGDYIVNPADSDFDAEVVTLFTGPSATGIEKLRGWLGTLTKAFADRTESLDAKIAEKPSAKVPAALSQMVAPVRTWSRTCSGQIVSPPWTEAEFGCDAS